MACSIRISAARRDTSCICDTTACRRRWGAHNITRSVPSEARIAACNIHFACGPGEAEYSLALSIRHAVNQAEFNGVTPSKTQMHTWIVQANHLIQQATDLAWPAADESERRARVAVDDASPPVASPYAGVCGGAKPSARLPSSARMTWTTALIRARWVKACGKFPRCRPVFGSISSAYRPRGPA